MTYSVDMEVFDFRLVQGWVDADTLDADSTAVLDNFTLADDQSSINLVPWQAIADEGSQYPQFTRYGQYSDQTQWSDGPTIATWVQGYFTEGMIFAWEEMLFTDEAVQTSQVTFKTRKWNGQPGYYQGYANRAIPNKDYKRGVYGVTMYKQQFVNCVEIFPTP